MRLFLTEKMSARRLGRRRFFSFPPFRFHGRRHGSWRTSCGVEDLDGARSRSSFSSDPVRACWPREICRRSFGFYVINRGGDSSRIRTRFPRPKIRCAGVNRDRMPVFKRGREPRVRGVARGLPVGAGAKKLDHFDFFCSAIPTSRSGDQEEVAWLELCKQVDGFRKIFYRKRKTLDNKKVGQRCGFLRRWDGVTVI